MPTSSNSIIIQRAKRKTRFSVIILILILTMRDHLLVLERGPNFLTASWLVFIIDRFFLTQCLYITSHSFLGMKSGIIFTVCMALVLSLGSIGVSSFAQNTTQVNQTGENAQGAVNETGEAAGNATEGLGGAVNETGEALSNATGGIMEGLQDLVNGSSP